ncbi:hypothetical protein IKF88_02505 [Candidatus Saccharibacteria bacterium]|nr:hypothetical protein [Candidatus Saccharibacteria bacterium]
MIHKQTITEALADYMVTVNCDASTAVDALSERFIEDIMKAEKIEPNYEEMDILNEVIVDALEDFTEDAEKLVNEWNEDARQMEEERREALRGRY